MGLEWHGAGFRIEGLVVYVVRSWMFGGLVNRSGYSVFMCVISMPNCVPQSPVWFTRDT
jgi:hypothetical protein